MSIVKDMFREFGFAFCVSEIFPMFFEFSVENNEMKTIEETMSIIHLENSHRKINTRFKEHRKDFRYAEGKSKFSEHVLNEGHEMKTIEETMSIIHLEKP